MSNEERLERIKRTTTHIYDSNTGECDGVDLPENDFDWLIGQAERVQDLEKMNNYLRSKKKENKRLREALKYYADEKKYEENIKTTYGYTCEIASDEGNTAKKALEQSK